ncbi:MAG TPA: fibronectin type III domain-containing protein, partial [Nitrosopumilaceae archaeon]|nr:fibronectin type III domain-containing protein [Nitrosopumilaceae archaeon]
MAQVSEPAAPQTITDLVVVPGNGEVRLSWTAPFDNGAPITSYKVVTWKTGSDVITTYPNLGTSTSTTITELTNGVSYSFSVLAVNSAGTSADSNVAIAKPVIPTSTPQPITDLVAVPGNGKMRLSWTAPFDNGAPITSYKVVMWKTGSDVITTYPNLGTSTATSITELTNGVSYSFMIYAVNSVGTSAESNVATAKPVTSASTAPRPITDLITLSRDGNARLIWTAPFDNGTPITSYKVVMWKTGSDVITTYPNLGTSTATTIKELTNGVSYSFKVYAVNSAGTSADSNVAIAKPVASAPSTDVPNRINDLVVTRDNGKVNLSWSKPNSNGDPLTSYVVTYWQVGTDNFVKKTLAADATKAQITNLTNGISYVFKINAKNGIGTSPDSNFDSATPSKSTTASVPNQVRKVIATPSSGQVVLSWIEPSDNGAFISSYVVIVSELGTNVFTTYPNLPDSTQTIITGLTNGK